jgi:formate hydrogenlyase subunit 3/multisubunit Na+/H+ antiporter MnhD subunit
MRVEGGAAVEWDLGLQGLGVLALMSLAFGAIAHLVAAKSTTRWVGVIGTAAYFICGLLISEVWFGWATEQELQPNIDGLSFDEVLLLATLSGLVAVFVLRYVARKRHHRHSSEADAPPVRSSWPRQRSQRS